MVGALYTFAVTAEEIVHEYFMTRFAEVRDDDDIERQLFGDYEAPQPGCLAGALAFLRYKCMCLPRSTPVSRERPQGSKNIFLFFCALKALRYAVTKSCGLLTKNIVGQDAAKALRIKFIEKLLEALDGVDYEHVQNDCRGFFGPNFELQHFCQRSKFVEVKMMPEVRAKILTATVSLLTTLNAAFKSVLSHFKPGAEDPSETAE